MDSLEHLPLSVRVADRRVEADGIVGLDLVAVEGMAELPAFTAGSHIDVEVCPGLVRQYSLCNAPTDRQRYRIAVLRELTSRGGSAAVHEKLMCGDVIRIGAPKNRFELIESAGHSLLIAGGIGITPLLSMAQQLQSTGKSFELHYSARCPERMAFRGLISSSPFASKATLHYSRENNVCRRLDLEKLLGRPQADTHVYVCGPAGFIAAVLDFARQRQWRDEQLHREYFVPESPSGTQESSAFRVRIASSGEEIEIPANRTVVSVLAEAGVVIPTFCEQGTCGTCLTRIVEGIPEHRDVVLTDEERARGDQFTPCCSRSKSSLLVLDL